MFCRCRDGTSIEGYFTASTLYEQSKASIWAYRLPEPRKFNLYAPMSSRKHPIQRPFQLEEILQSSFSVSNFILQLKKKKNKTVRIVFCTLFYSMHTYLQFDLKGFVCFCEQNRHRVHVWLKLMNLCL